MLILCQYTVTVCSYTKYLKLLQCVLLQLIFDQNTVKCQLANQLVKSGQFGDGYVVYVTGLVYLYILYHTI